MCICMSVFKYVFSETTNTHTLQENAFLHYLFACGFFFLKLELSKHDYPDKSQENVQMCFLKWKLSENVDLDFKKEMVSLHHVLTCVS